MAAIDQPFTMSAGQDATIAITVRDANKTLVNLTGYTATWHLATARQGTIICEKSTDAGGIVIPTQTGGNVGIMNITLVPEDTQTLDGVYWHECWITAPKKVPICHGQVKIEGNTIS